MKKHYALVTGLILAFFYNHLSAANDSIYEQRRNAYIDSCLANFSTFDITLQAYRGIPVNQAAYDTFVVQLPTDGTADFELVQVVRILFLTNGQYDSIALATFPQIPFWLTSGEQLWDYWSENHMCQWLSSDYLLHQKYNFPVDNRLNYRVKHYLELKVQYGFYEFLSTDYGPYCLNGLLNLADFATDTTIKNLAIQASQKLLKDMLMCTNSLGVCYPAAGRNYYGKYEDPYSENYNNLVWLLTGFGQQQTGPSPGGVVLASSSLPVDTIISSWTPHLDTTLIIGHTLDSGFVINDSLQVCDKVLFQWSSGAYFHPEVAAQTSQLLTDSNLWFNPNFSMFAPFRLTSLNEITADATTASYISESSVICNDTVKIFKDYTVTLSSVQNFWPGKLGYEEIPCVANVGTTAVFTASGAVIANFENRSATNENNDLPLVRQKSNVAMLMYRPDVNLPLLGYNQPAVSLHFIDSVYDEVAYDSLWLFGRQGNGYVAVRRGCLDSVNGLRACMNPVGQTWIIMVGDSNMYGSFSNFQSIVDSSQYQENWTYDSTTMQWNYQAQITIDTITINSTWYGDSTLVNPATAIQNVPAGNGSIRVYPNPFTSQISLTGLQSGIEYHLTLTDIQGRILEQYRLTGTGATYTLNLPATLASGMYLLQLSNGDAVEMVKIVKD